MHGHKSAAYLSPQYFSTFLHIPGCKRAPQPPLNLVMGGNGFPQVVILVYLQNLSTIIQVP
jgi:hypothetical protein